ncbi:MAG TPA: YccF domain-containing protein [Arthrobacter sp.]|jgi:uncharacterized membrane protein YccF (DUF307 family)|nr:YccF domain-containing protein [Arthrobacter sp.]
MRAILNIIWLLLGGIWLAAGYFLAGIICCALIITIPFGIASFRIAGYALWPFGRKVVDKGGRTYVMSTLGNIIWILVAGIWIAIGHVATAIAQAVTIIGIPMAIANLKMIPVSLTPLGKEIVPTDRPFIGYDRQYPIQYPVVGYDRQYPGQGR